MIELTIVIGTMSICRGVGILRPIGVIGVHLNLVGWIIAIGITYVSSLTKLTRVDGVSWSISTGFKLSQYWFWRHCPHLWLKP